MFFQKSYLSYNKSVIIFFVKKKKSFPLTKSNKCFIMPIDRTNVRRCVLYLILNIKGEEGITTRVIESGSE